MSDRKDDFWRELMGEEPLPEDDKSSENMDFSEETGGAAIDSGFTIEYVNRDGEKIPEPKKEPAEPKRNKPEDRRSPEARKPEPRRRERSKKEDDFEIDFDFDREYEDVEEKPVRRGRTKRTGCLGGIAVFLLVICVSVVLASLGWMAAVDVLGLDGKDVPVEVTIEKSIFSKKDKEIENEDGTVTITQVESADIDVVAKTLKEQGLIEYEWLFKLFAKFASADEKIKAGTYQLSQAYDYRALVNGMTPGGGKKVEITVTIPEGYTVTQIIDLLVKNEVCDKEELLDAMANYDFDYDFLDDAALGDAKRLEGYLFPDTYDFYVGDTPSRVINKLLKNFNNKWTEEFDNMAEALGYTPYEVLIIASMIEKEAGVDAERADIASVIYNRLENPGTQGTVGLLQIDATIYYVTADTGEEFSTEIDSPYNTYLYKGLTPGPIANPGMASIKAALDPSDTRYYYYALGAGNAHEFFETYEGFQNFINSDDYKG